MNFALTDGVHVICTRYVNHGSQAASLFFSSGTNFEQFETGKYRMVPLFFQATRYKSKIYFSKVKSDRRENVVIITSEPLTFESSDWLAVPSNCILSITKELNVLLEPILDEHYPGDPGSIYLR